MIKVTVNTLPVKEPERKYPYIGTKDDIKAVVLFTQPKVGFCLSHNNSDHVMTYSGDWLENLFTQLPIGTSITLEVQDPHKVKKPSLIPPIKTPPPPAKLEFNKCPYGYVFGVDIDQKDDCASECEAWDDCNTERDRLMVEKSKQKPPKKDLDDFAMP